jgi:hypothetical protein
MNEAVELGRKKSIGIILGGVLFAAVNHYLITQVGTTLQILVVIGPALLGLGVAGLADPRIIEAMDKSKKHLYPSWCFIVGVVAILVGVGLGFWGAVELYGIGF